MRTCSFFFALFLILMLSCYSPTAQRFELYPPTANLSTTWTNNATLGNGDELRYMLVRVTDVTPLILCGFTCEGNCTTFIFSIFIFHIDVVVWSANRNNPVRENATVNFTAAGDLVLKDADGSIVWATNTAGKSVAGMNLTDTGNLVLYDHQNSVVWQSFDHPTDCLLPGQKLFTGQQLISSVSDTNPSEGMYSLQVMDKGLIGYVKSNPPQAYYSRLIHGNDTNKGKKYIRFLNGSLSLFIHSSEPRDDGYIYIPEASSALSQYIKLMPDGHLKVFEGGREAIDLTESLVYGYCTYPLVCGRNSICSTKQQCSCPGTKYFRPVNNLRPNLGCSENTPLTCSSTKDQHLITLENISYFTAYASTAADMKRVNMKTCKNACRNNCSCKAAFFRYGLNASSGDCFLVSEILTMKTVTPYDLKALAFLKVQNVRSHHVARVVGSTVGTFVLLLLVAIGFIMYIVHKRKGDAETEDEYLDQVPGMPTRFSYEDLKIATANFSKKLGEGGFGSVFEGVLEDGSKIAVKCLEGLSHMKKSFLAEVQSIGSIHHVNLVRLRGFCTWKSQRFLVKKIILDIAKGLAYLHEECRQKIIHLDIKPQNILLDDDFNAKVSDFGLAKLIDRNQSQVMTTMRGTPGYLAPEWLSSVITEKVDVYSFGIVLLEILCGRKNFDRSQPEEENWHLLRVFQKCWEQEKLLDMVDINSEDMQINGTEVVELMKMASWCLQTDYTQRPSMSMVVKALEGGMNVESNLDYNFTDPRPQKNNSQEKDLTPLLPSILSGPRFLLLYL
ncbi:putative protein kinase RLK-Pelle-SD-2b family [Helianthus annuus]|nr:putative protein kinase RLK-Pelle-SD-2b family [Helianthus annuus]